MSTNAYDQYRPPEQSSRRRRRQAEQAAATGTPAQKLMAGAAKSARRFLSANDNGGREMPMVPDPEFVSYYGRPVVKAPPWENKVAAYLFLGGLAGGSGLLAFGAQCTGNDALRRASRLSALTSAGAGSVLLMADLGRPERFLHMLRTFKPTSPMSVGSWILVSFSSFAGVAAAGEVDRMTGQALPLGPLRALLRVAEPVSGALAAVFAAPLAGYTAVLLSDTAMPTWNAAREDLPFVFVSSASLAAGGLAMVLTPVDAARPARILAVMGAAADVTATRLMERRMDPVTAEPLHEGIPGTLMRLSERFVIGGGLGALLGGGNRVVAALSGAALMAGSALTRFGVFHAGLESARDPRYTIEPQRRRLQERQARGITDDSITTAF